MMRNLQPGFSENAPKRPGCGTSPNTGPESRFHPAAAIVRPRGAPHHQLRPPGTRQIRVFVDRQRTHVVGLRSIGRAAILATEMSIGSADRGCSSALSHYLK